MTPDELAAIRARVAGFMPLQLSGYMGYTLTRADALDLAVERDTLVRDRRALLAEVDRLTAGINDYCDCAMARHDERARIRAAVEGMEGFDAGDLVSRSAVLAAIRGLVPGWPSDGGSDAS